MHMLAFTSLHAEFEMSSFTHSKDMTDKGPKFHKHQLLLTNPHDALHHTKRAANKDGHSL